MLTWPVPGVEQRPQLGPLLFGQPLAKAVAVAEDAFFGAGFFLVAPCAADQAVEAVLFDGFKQRHGLVEVARLQRMRQAHRAAFHAVLQVADHQALAHLGDTLIPEGDHFREVVSGIDMQQREGQFALEVIAAPSRIDSGFEGFFCQPQHHARILAARKQQRWPFKRSCDFPQDEDRLFFQPVEVALVQFGQQGIQINTRVHAEAPIIETVFCETCRPHSLSDSSSHHQRPARKSSPTAMARVQGAQPMLGMNWSCSGL